MLVVGFELRENASDVFCTGPERMKPHEAEDQRKGNDHEKEYDKGGTNGYELCTMKEWRWNRHGES